MHSIRRIHRHATACAWLAIFAAALPPAALAQDPDPRAADADYTYVGTEYSYANFQGDIAAWHLGALSIGRATSAGSFIARVNWARRSGSSGVQVEADAYPGLGENT